LLSHVVWQTVALDIDGSGVGCGWCAKTKRGTSSRTSISLWCKQSNVWYQRERREGWALGRALVATSSLQQTMQDSLWNISLCQLGLRLLEHFLNEGLHIPVAFHRLFIDTEQVSGSENCRKDSGGVQI